MTDSCEWLRFSQWNNNNPIESLLWGMLCMSVYECTHPYLRWDHTEFQFWHCWGKAALPLLSLTSDNMSLHDLQRKHLADTHTLQGSTERPTEHNRILNSMLTVYVFYCTWAQYSIVWLKMWWARACFGS